MGTVLLSLHKMKVLLFSLLAVFFASATPDAPRTGRQATFPLYRAPSYYFPWTSYAIPAVCPPAAPAPACDCKCENKDENLFELQVAATGNPDQLELPTDLTIIPIEKNVTATEKPDSSLFEEQNNWIIPCNNLENLVNNYRARNGLHRLDCHDKPRYIAKLHTYDGHQAKSRCTGNLHQWKSWYFTDGRPCIDMDCTLCRATAGYEFCNSVKWLDCGNWEISYGGRGTDQARLDGWIRSPGHNKIMLTSVLEIIGCYNNDAGFAHCVFY